ncbi:MAG: hypothetical protein LW875_02855 [Proteobacteria bacterium]|jgi:hypothetical protein|nr:hypothetical protein [Pseudomonadota bacterium]
MKLKSVFLVCLIHIVASKSSAATEVMTAVTASRNQSDGQSVILRDRTGQVIGEISCDNDAKIVILDGDTNPEFKLQSHATCLEVQNWSLKNLIGKGKTLIVRLNTTSLIVENIEMK